LSLNSVLMLLDAYPDAFKAPNVVMDVFIIF